MKTHVYSASGKKVSEIKLPKVFEEEYNPKAISRAFIAKHSKTLQPKGSDPLAGFRTTAEYIGRRRAYRTGINTSRSRLPRTKPGGGGLGRVARVPQAVGGRKAHPPKVEKVILKKINKKEYALALRSAIAATANKALIADHGYALNGIAEIPIVFNDSIQNITKTKEAVAALAAVGLADELKRGKQKKIRAGKGTKRGNKYKKKKSVLVIVTEGGKAFRNIPGVDVMSVSRLSIDKLAPGAKAGRLTVYTESAIKQLGDKYGN